MVQLLISAIKSFSFKERMVFWMAFVFFVISSISLSFFFIEKSTVKVPASGGEFIEGVVGQPAFINPVLAKPGTVDDDLVALTFANLLDLSESLKSEKNFKVWTLRLKENARWQDETPITSDDVIFTIQAIQDPDVLSPLFSDWQNIKVSRVSEREIRFELPTSYSLFENLLKKLRPIPKKIFADIAPANIKLSSYNLEPFGSGPFLYEKMERKKDGFISQFQLKINPAYRSIGSLPYLKRFTFHFFENEEGLIEAYNSGIIDGFLATDYSLIDKIEINSLTEKIPTTKYYALFFNPNANPILESKEIRKALQLATDINSLINQEFKGYALLEAGPIPPTLPSYNKEIEKDVSFNPSLAKELIANAGWIFNPEINLWQKVEKNNSTQELAVILKTPDTPLLLRMAQRIQKDWQAIGIKTEIEKYDPALLGEEIIKNRDYQILLFGNIVSLEPDLFSFWHSTERFYPGLNLSFFNDSLTDNLIALSRQVAPQDPQRNKLLFQIQERITSELGALFLVNPQYLYIHRASRPQVVIETLSLASDRFEKVNQWHIKTKRKFKGIQL